jgi:hypothetical protein
MKLPNASQAILEIEKYHETKSEITRRGCIDAGNAQP